MPNPAMINKQSSKLKHFMGIADVYIALGRPEVFTVEPQVTDEYRPDAYTRLGRKPVIIELQRSTISTVKMQNKVDQFMQSYKRNKHDAKTLLIVSDSPYSVQTVDGFHIEQKSLTQLS